LNSGVESPLTEPTVEELPLKILEITNAHSLQMLELPP